MVGDEVIRAKAVINEQYRIEIVGDGLRDLLGDNVSRDLTYSIYADDRGNFENAMNTAGSGEETFVALRIANETFRYKWVIVYITPAKGTEGDGKFYTVWFYDIDVFKYELDSIEDNYNRYMEYFSLIDRFMLEYDMLTGELKVFMMGSHQQVNFYNGTLESFKHDKLNNADVDDKSVRAFGRLCEDIAEGTDVFEHQIDMKLLESSTRMGRCVFRGKTIELSGGRKKVIAVIASTDGDGPDDGSSVYAAARDAGTDLLNKRSITSYAHRCIERKPSHNVSIAVIDIDNFKDVNDKYGHMVGDEIISAVAEVIKEAVEGKGVAGRIGGDEMMIVVENTRDEEELRTILRTIRNNVAWLNNEDENKPHITCSAGVSSYPKDGDDYDDLFRIADKMLYLAKEKGRNRYIIYTNELHREYLYGTGEAKIDPVLMYKHRKLSVLNDIIYDYSTRGSECFEEIAQKVAITYDIDSITLYEKNGDDDWSRYVIYGDNIPKQNCLFMDRDNYYAGFSADGYKPIDNITYFERKAKTLYEEFTGLGVHQAVQVIVTEYEPKLRVVSFNRNKQLKKWSDSDIMQLSILGNIFGAGFSNDK